MSKSNFGDSSSGLRNMPSEKVWGPTTDEGFDVPPSDDEDSPAHHLNTINSMEK
jgi:hypothetical protein